MSSEFILASRNVVTPGGVRDGGIFIRDGRITALLPRSAFLPGIRVEDEGELVVMPGLVDTHVHINEPGRTEWEGFETATKAAAAGGITTLIEMPLNSSPVTTSVGAFREKVAAAEGKLWVDCGFYAGVVPANTKELKPLLSAGVFGVKAFLIHSGIDEFPNVGEADLRQALPEIAASGLPLLVHCELQNGVVPGKDARSYANYLASRPDRWELDAITLMIRLCREFRTRLHIVHLSSATALQVIHDSRREGLPITIETCPHYLYFIAEEIQDGDTRFKCAPPIRNEENREELWNALSEGMIDFIVSDHSPSPPDMKFLQTGDFAKAWGGISSLQFGLSIIWTEMRKRGMKIENLSRWMSRGPAELVGLEERTGSISNGREANFVVWDPEEQFTVQQSMIFHRHKLTPYEGRMLFGKVHSTYLRGEKVFGGESPGASPKGRVLLREPT